MPGRDPTLRYCTRPAILTYVVDLYRRVARVQKNPLNPALYISRSIREFWRR